MPHLDTFESIGPDELLTVSGGLRLPKTNATGSGPMHPMELLDKPGKTLDMLRQGLGIPESGSPGDRYTPATANPDGSINPGRFDSPVSDGPQVPMSQ